MTVENRKKSIRDQIGRVAETHFFLRNEIANRLKQIIFKPGEVMHRLTNGKYPNYFEYWVGIYNDRFFDMGTFARLGSVMETGFRDYYMEKKGHSNLVALKKDPAIAKAGSIFQRIKPVTKGNLR